jgi:hypothetical protein
MTGERLDELELAQVASDNTALAGTALLLQVDRGKRRGERVIPDRKIHRLRKSGSKECQPRPVCLVHRLVDADDQHVPCVVRTAARAGRDESSFVATEPAFSEPKRMPRSASASSRQDRPLFGEPKTVTSAPLVHSSIGNFREDEAGRHPPKGARSVKTSAADDGTLSGQTRSMAVSDLHKCRASRNASANIARGPSRSKRQPGDPRDQKSGGRKSRREKQIRGRPPW